MDGPPETQGSSAVLFHHYVPNQYILLEIKNLIRNKKCNKK